MAGSFSGKTVGFDPTLLGSNPSPAATALVDHKGSRGLFYYLNALNSTSFTSIPAPMVMVKIWCP